MSDEVLTWPDTRFLAVELRGFEPLTPSMRTRCATGLRYSPKNASQRSKPAKVFAHAMGAGVRAEGANRGLNGDSGRRAACARLRHDRPSRQPTSPRGRDPGTEW